MAGSLRTRNPSHKMACSRQASIREFLTLFNTVHMIQITSSIFRETYQHKLEACSCVVKQSLSGSKRVCSNFISCPACTVVCLVPGFSNYFNDMFSLC